MKILVIGGRGYIGTNLIKSLKDKITVLDNKSNVHSDEIPGINYIYDSSINIEKYGNDYDLVIHLGEYSRVEQSFNDIEEVIESNVNGTVAVIEFCRKNNIRLIYANSSSTFSGSDLSPYTFFKDQNTKLIQNYGKWFGLDYSIVVFYNVYGKDKDFIDNKSTVISIFENCRKKGLKIPVVLPGTQKRNFTHIDDIVDGIKIIIKKGGKDIYCIGSDESYSILEVAKMFGDVIFLEERKGNRKSTHIDNSKLKSLGWNCKHNLKDFIEKSNDS